MLLTTKYLSELRLLTEAGQWRVMKTQLYPIKREVRVTCPAPLLLSVALSPPSPTSLFEYAQNKIFCEDFAKSFQILPDLVKMFE